MTTAPDVDWAAVEQRARREELLVAPLLAAWFAIPLAALAGARWERPAITVPAAVVLVAVTAVAVRPVHRQYRDAVRWVADPPGPEREVAPPTRLESWTSGRWSWLVVGGAFLLAVAVGLIAGLAW